MPVLHARRRWAAVAVAVLLLAGGGTAWALTRTTASAATGNWVAATTGTIQQTVNATGTIEPARQSVLTFGVSGAVASVAASVGEKVASGTVLATLDSTTLQTAVTTTTASVTAAEQQLSSVSGSSSVQVTAAVAQLAAAKTALARAEDDLAAATLRAPFSGVVASVGLAVGDSINANSNTTNTNAKAITVISTDSWVVDAGVGSADLAQLKKGLQAQIVPSGATNRIFGTIASIGIVATSTSGGTATFPVVIAITGNPAGLYAGGSANVSLTVRQVPNALTVPTLALHTAGDKTVVYQRVGTERLTRVVTVGASYGPTTQIMSGLTAGDEVEVSFGRTGLNTTTRRSRTGGSNQQRQNFGRQGGFSGGSG